MVRREGSRERSSRRSWSAGTLSSPSSSTGSPTPRRGAGQLLFVAGEAGIGKTRLLSAVARRADAGGFAVVRAAAFPDDVQSLAGLLLDLAGNLLPAREPALSELGRSLTSRVRGDPRCRR